MVPVAWLPVRLILRSLFPAPLPTGTPSGTTSRGSISSSRPFSSATTGTATGGLTRKSSPRFSQTWERASSETKGSITQTWTRTMWVLLSCAHTFRAQGGAWGRRGERLLPIDCLTLRCDAMRCDAMRCEAMRCDAMWCDATVLIRPNPTQDGKIDFDEFKASMTRLVHRKSITGSTPGTSQRTSRRGSLAPYQRRRTSEGGRIQRQGSSGVTRARLQGSALTLAASHSRASSTGSEIVSLSPLSCA